MEWLLKIQTLSFCLLLLPFCHTSPELLVAALQGFQGFSVLLQCYRGVVPVGRDCLGCSSSSKVLLLPVPGWLDLPDVGFPTLLKWPNPVGCKGRSRGKIHT